MDINPLWITGAIGAVIGAMGAFFGNLYLQIRKERNEKKAIRIMLKIEINHNLDTIKDIYNYIKNLKSVGDDATNWFKGQQLSLLDEMTFNKPLWNSKSPIYAIALTEGEINRIENFYITLDEIAYYHGEMRTITRMHLNNHEKSEQNWNEYFSLSDRWETFEKTAKTVIERGNSIIVELGN